MNLEQELPDGTVPRPQTSQ